MEKVKCSHCEEINNTNAKYCFRCGYELPEMKMENIGIITPSTSKKEMLKNKNLFGLIIGIVAFGLAYFLVQQVFFKPPSYDKLMMKAASELNEVCPMMVDADTRLDNAMALPPNSFQYNYTLVNLLSTDINVEEFRTYMLPQLINNIKTNPDMSAFRENEVSIIYVYRDKEGGHITKITISPKDYVEMGEVQM